MEKSLNKERPLLTPRAKVEIASHEGVVLEAYKDSKGIWTWGIGVTNASGHQVYPRYLNNPQTLERVLEVFAWLLETKYAPDVIEAFKGVQLTENQFAAALSFHYNTGAIKRASWVKSFLAGKQEEAEKKFLEWNKPKEIMERRKKEANLFFHGVWSNDGKLSCYPVSKPSYTPRWREVRRVEVQW